MGFRLSRFQAAKKIKVHRVAIARVSERVGKGVIRTPNQMLYLKISAEIKCNRSDAWARIRVDASDSAASWTALRTLASRLATKARFPFTAESLDSTQSAHRESGDRRALELMRRGLANCRNRLKSSASADPFPVKLGEDGWPLGGSRLFAERVVAYETYPLPPDPSGSGVNDFSDYFQPGSPDGPSARSMRETAALRLGLSILRLRPRTIIISDPHSSFSAGFKGETSSDIGIGSAKLAGNKDLTVELLRNANLPTAAGRTFHRTDVNRAIAFGEELGFPLVVKPSWGSMGRGITTGIASPEELRKAFNYARQAEKTGGSIIVERFVEGSDYRILATQHDVISVSKRDPAAIIGNGTDTVFELILQANASRRYNPFVCRKLIKVDDDLVQFLRKHEIGLDYVPPLNSYLQLSGVANLSRGGTNEEVLDETDSSILNAAIRATRVTGLKLAGVDIILKDHRKPLSDQIASITEVNSAPETLGHPFPVKGPSRNVYETELRNMLTRSGATAQNPQNVLTVQLTVNGLVQGVEYGEWLDHAAREMGLAIKDSGNSRKNSVGAIVHGDAPTIARLLESAIHGPPASYPTDILVDPVTDFAVTDFHQEEQNNERHS